MKVFLLCYKNDSCQKYLAENLTSRLSFGTMNRRIKKVGRPKKYYIRIKSQSNLTLRKIKCPLMKFARVHYEITTIYFYLEHFICSPADKESHYFFPQLYFFQNEILPSLHKNLFESTRDLASLLSPLK